jgi:TrmH family RNA methyltransferase
VRFDQGEADLSFDCPEAGLARESVEDASVVRDLEGETHGGGIADCYYIYYYRACTTVARVRVVLVEPKYEGNVGAVARAMKNFGVADLRLVKPPPIGEEARRRAMHGLDVLLTAKKYRTFAASIREAGLIVGTSGVKTESEKKFHRQATTPRELAAKLASLDGDVALVLGREDFGLLNEELVACDVLVTIPADPEYPILNVAQAAAILLYEIHAAKGGVSDPRQPASGAERDTLYEAFDDLLMETNYPSHKLGRTKVMFRRLMGRAAPSKWEFHALMGVIARAAKTIRRERAKTAAKPRKKS